MKFACAVALALCLALPTARGAEPPAPPPANETAASDARLAEYFRDQTARLANASLADIRTLEDWTSRRGEYRRQLFEMLGLDPLPEKSDLEAVIAGRVEHDLFTVENLHFQSRPGLYVTANLYIPKGLTGPAPAVLYVCGHGEVKKDGVSYGNKTHYQHHPAWLARNGYVCLAIDTLQLGEIQGKHHGTHNLGMWWWLSRGYTPAGVEAWNCLRALDYLQSRPEVDGSRLGVTGRSGGGAYSWWIAALDDRIRAAVPVAGVTDLEDHVVNGCVDGHCDCMYYVNTYGWDFDILAALVAPRPLLIVNTDKDSIFPLEGVLRIHREARRIYRLYGADDKLGLLIAEGPHKDTQELQVPAFHWLNRFLKTDDPPVEDAGRKFFAPEQLKVFAELPGDEQNTCVEGRFVMLAPELAPPADWNAWSLRRDALLPVLRRKSFGGWPTEEAVDADLQVRVQATGAPAVRIVETVSFQSQPHVVLTMRIVRSSEAPPREIVLHLPSETAPPIDAASDADLGLDRGLVQVAFEPRGTGADAWNADPRKQVQIRRRFMLLGQTVPGMRAWDVRRAVRALRQTPALAQAPVRVEAAGAWANIAVCAALFEPGISALSLDAPLAGQAAPEILNLDRLTTWEELFLLAAETRPIDLKNATASRAAEAAARFPDKFRLRTAAK